MTEEKRQHSRPRKKDILKIKPTKLGDGYTWRKYYEHDIIGRKYPKEYYRCTYGKLEGCPAMKEVQRDDVDPERFNVTYMWAHTCCRRTAAAFDVGYSTSGFPSVQNEVKHQAAKRSLEFTGYNRSLTMNKERVVNLLQSDYGEEHNVSVFAIVGAEGAGKTTLASLVYDDLVVCEAFELRSWVCLTRVDNVEQMLRAIIKALTTLSCHPFQELSELQEIVKEEVASRKYLLVLDDMWDTRVLGTELCHPLMFGGKGSKILVTTAKEEIGMGTTLLSMSPSYKLSDISQLACWQIMKECALYDTDPSVHPDTTAVGRRMALLCEGKPLAARILGGTLRAKLHDAATPGCDVLDSCLREPDENRINILLALRLSYGFLPDSLKKCLLYCSVFPKGYVFEKNYLIRLWLAQGYIEHQNNDDDDDDDDEDEEKIGNDYLDELLDRSFLQRSRNPNFAKQPCYEMHGSVHDELQQTSRREEAFQAEDYKKVHVVSFISDKSGSSNDFEVLKDSRDLESLLIDRHLLEFSGRKKIQILSPKMLSDLLDNLPHLKALDLSFSNIKELPTSIEKLKSLNYLGLNNTNIRKLPASLCNISDLQTLELQDCVYLQNLPQEINKLTNLRHLDTRKRSGCIGIPRGLGQLTRLRTLSAFSVAEENEWHSGINELNNLVNLKGDLCVGGLRHVIDDKEAGEANLDNKDGLASLTLQWSTSGREVDGDEMDGKAIKVFENLEPHRKLKQLVVRDYSGDQFPGWIGDPSFYKLISITLDNCRWCEKLPPLGQIASLKHLFIRRMDSVQRVGREFLGCEESGWDAFPSLETLKIWEMYNLKEWYGVKGKDFPCLRIVSISKCFKLGSFPCLPALVELTIHHGVQVPALSNLHSLRSLSIEGFHSLKAFVLQPGLVSVLKLEVKDCSQLSFLLRLENSRNLREIKLDRCPILELEPDDLPLTLEVVHIHHSCSLLSDWCPSGFQEDGIFGQTIGRRLVREKQQVRKWQDCQSTREKTVQEVLQTYDWSCSDLETRTTDTDKSS